jgi:hypothetical protein
VRRITVVVPTYWSWPRGEVGLAEDAIFDHPTPVDQAGTLARCLDSLKAVTARGFQVLVITACVNPRLEAQVEDRVESLIRPYRAFYPIGQFGPSDLLRVRSTLERRGIEPKLVSLEAYAQIRNCQILGSVLLDSELIVAIDDDEIVPPDYLDKALQSLVGAACTAEAAASAGTEVVAGLAGVYLDSRGRYRLSVSPAEAASGNKFIRKAALINAQFEACFAEERRFVETPVALGGNMVFPPELFRNVAFDPGITRGEDIDYLMNSRLFGYRWLLDKELVITHLPPGISPGDPVTSSRYGKLQRDVLRFVYQREKIRVSWKLTGVHPLTAEEFGIYPGEFLKDDLEAQALEALGLMRPAEAHERFFPHPEALLAQAKARAEAAAHYPAFNESWKKILATVDRDRGNKEALRRKLEL